MSDENEVEADDEVETGLESDGYVAADLASDDEAGAGSITARQAIRDKLQNDIEAFLAAGGRINEIPPNVIADPPRKPESNYGGQPI